MAAREGYARLTVERIIATAGVSRATFYQYFANVDECFRGAYRHHAEVLIADVTAAAGVAEQRELAVLEALVATAAARPDAASLLMREGLAAGPLGLRERDALISAIERVMTCARPAHRTLDLPPAIAIGGLFRFLSMSLCDGSTLDGLSAEVRQWAVAFARQAWSESWSAKFAPAFPDRTPMADATHTRPRQQASARERILHATAATICAKGYRDITVADIVRIAGVSRRGFYNLFHGKADAFAAAYERGFQQTLAACTPAFFVSADWPERVWHSAHAFTSVMAREPLTAYLGFVECHAPGPGFAPRMHDTQLAFTLFLEEGYRQRPQAQSLPRTCSALTATAIFELGFEVSRHGPSLLMRCMQPLAVYIALAPFIGRDEAGEFVSGRLFGESSDAPAAA